MLTIISYHPLGEQTRAQLEEVSAHMQIIEQPYPESVPIEETLKTAKGNEYLTLIAFCEKKHNYTDDYEGRSYYDWRYILCLASKHGETKVVFGHQEEVRGYVTGTQLESLKGNLEKLPLGTVKFLVKKFHETWKQPALL